MDNCNVGRYESQMENFCKKLKYEIYKIRLFLMGSAFFCLKMMEEITW
jgi:hypothetical protein